MYKPETWMCHDGNYEGVNNNNISEMRMSKLFLYTNHLYQCNWLTQAKHTFLSLQIPEDQNRFYGLAPLHSWLSQFFTDAVGDTAMLVIK